MRQNLLQGKYGWRGHPATACNPAGMNQDEKIPHTSSRFKRNY